MQPRQSVKKYFHRTATEFDGLYEGGVVHRAVNRLLRKGIFERAEAALDRIAEADAPRVLDVGCGSGRIAVEACRIGASEVVGVDFAEAMLELARSRASQAGVSDDCRFLAGDFLEAELPEESFDVVVALGYFDYTPDPRPHLERMRAACRGRLVASFPAPSLRIPLRKLRYGARGVEVRAYEREEVATLLQEAGFDHAEVRPCASSGWIGEGITR